QHLGDQAAVFLPSPLGGEGEEGAAAQTAAGPACYSNGSSPGFVGFSCRIFQKAFAFPDRPGYPRRLALSARAEAPPHQGTQAMKPLHGLALFASLTAVALLPGLPATDAQSRCPRFATVQNTTIQNQRTAAFAQAARAAQATATPGT